VQLEPAVREAVDLVAERYKGGLPIPVDVEVDASLQLWADRGRLSQVLRALVDNAVKFSDGEGRVTIRAHRTSRGKREVRVEVADRGIGIAADDLDRIFDRFYQVDNTATRRYGGTGMGLALVKRLVQAHAARISVESELGKGTKVILRWPAVSPIPATDAAETPAVASPPAAEAAVEPAPVSVS